MVPQRCADLVLHEGAEGPFLRTRSPPNFGDDPAKGITMVGVGRARFEPRLPLFAHRWIFIDLYDQDQQFALTLCWSGDSNCRSHLVTLLPW